MSEEQERRKVEIRKKLKVMRIDASLGNETAETDQERERLLAELDLFEKQCPDYCQDREDMKERVQRAELAVLTAQSIGTLTSATFKNQEDARVELKALREEDCSSRRLA